MSTLPEVEVEPLLFPIDKTRARLGGISRTKLYAEMAAGELDYIQIGDRRFTTDEHQRDYIARKAQKARAA